MHPATHLAHAIIDHGLSDALVASFTMQSYNNAHLRAA